MIVKLIPKTKCPLDFIAEMGEITKNARIYLGTRAMEKLSKTADSDDFLEDEKVGFFERFLWEETGKYPETILEITPGFDDWWKVIRISASDIAFETDSEEPSEIIYLEMEE